MGDLISRSRLKAELDAWAWIITKPQYYHREDADFVIDSQAAVDIVHCKDCAKYNISGCADGFGWCEQFNHGKMDNGYCDCGERKEQ